MARKDDTQRDEFDTEEDEDLEEEEQEDESDSDDSTDDSSEETDSEVKGDAKRIKDLQSKADAETARANKAEKALAKMRGEGDADPATQRLVAELREASLDAVFGEFPELREFGINRDLVEGTTRAELRVNAKALVSLIKNVSTKARNKALAEAGVTPAPAGSRRESPKDYNAMSDEDFGKELARLTGR